MKNTDLSAQLNEQLKQVDKMLTDKEKKKKRKRKSRRSEKAAEEQAKQAAQAAAAAQAAQQAAVAQAARSGILDPFLFKLSESANQICQSK